MAASMRISGETESMAGWSWSGASLPEIHEAKLLRML